MIFSIFGGGKSEPEAAIERGPLQVAIGGAIELDTLSLQAAMAAGEPAMPPPAGGTLIVAAIGEARLDGDTVLTRYYDTEDQLLQVLASPGGGRETISDVSLYRPWDSVTPMTDAEWDRWTGRNGLIGQAHYDADGILFDRFWGEGAGKVDLVEFTEQVDDGQTRRSIHQRCMLYARPVGSIEEMLLINVERDLGDQHARQGGSVEFMIGYGLSPADVTRV